MHTLESGMQQELAAGHPVQPALCAVLSQQSKPGSTLSRILLQDRQLGVVRR